MSEFEKNVTFVIVCFRSRSIIEECLSKISCNSKVIIIENSKDFSIKNYLEKKLVLILFIYQMIVSFTFSSKFDLHLHFNLFLILDESRQ